MEKAVIEYIQDTNNMDPEVDEGLKALDKLLKEVHTLIELCTLKEELRLYLEGIKEPSDAFK